MHSSNLATCTNSAFKWHPTPGVVYTEGLLLKVRIFYANAFSLYNENLPNKALFNQYRHAYSLKTNNPKLILPGNKTVQLSFSDWKGGRSLQVASFLQVFAVPQRPGTSGKFKSCFCGCQRRATSVHVAEIIPSHLAASIHSDIIGGGESAPISTYDGRQGK